MNDRLAIGVSAACMMHCLLTPFSIGLGVMGVMGEWLSSEWLHQLLLVPVVVLALVSLPAAYRAHRQHWPLVMAMVAIPAMLGALLLPESLALLVTLPAALLLIFAHGWNLVLVRRQQALEVAVNG